MATNWCWHRLHISSIATVFCELLVHVGVLLLHYLGSKQISLNRGVTKRLDLPTSPWSLVELFLDHPVTKCGLINHVDVMDGSFIMHAPPTISE
jgi:hypothetical protein